MPIVARSGLEEPLRGVRDARIRERAYPRADRRARRRGGFGDTHREAPKPRRSRGYARPDPVARGVGAYRGVSRRIEKRARHGMLRRSQTLHRRGSRPMSRIALATAILMAAATLPCLG